MDPLVNSILSQVVGNVHGNGNNTQNNVNQVKQQAGNGGTNIFNAASKTDDASIENSLARLVGGAGTDGYGCPKADYKPPAQPKYTEPPKTTYTPPIIKPKYDNKPNPHYGSQPMACPSQCMDMKSVLNMVISILQIISNVASSKN